MVPPPLAGVGASSTQYLTTLRTGKQGGKPDRWPVEPTVRAGRCRGAGLQYDRKNKGLGPYPVGNGLSKRKQLESQAEPNGELIALEFMRSAREWNEVPLAECFSHLGRNPVGLKRREFIYDTCV